MIIGTVIRTRTNTPEHKSGTLGIVIDEFNRGDEPGGSRGAQVLIDGGIVQGVSQDEWPDRFEICGFNSQLDSYVYKSKGQIIADYNGGHFSRLFRSREYKCLDDNYVVPLAKENAALVS